MKSKQKTLNQPSKLYRNLLASKQNINPNIKLLDIKKDNIK